MTKPLWLVAREAYKESDSTHSPGAWRQCALAVIGAFLALPKCGECRGKGYMPQYPLGDYDKCPACQGLGRRVE